MPNMMLISIQPQNDEMVIIKEEQFILLNQIIPLTMNDFNSVK